MARRGLKFGIFMAPFHRLGENPTLGIGATINSSGVSVTPKASGNVGGATVTVSG